MLITGGVVFSFFFFFSFRNDTNDIRGFFRQTSPEKRRIISHLPSEDSIYLERDDLS